MQVIIGSNADYITCFDLLTDTNRHIITIKERFLILTVQTGAVRNNYVPQDFIATPWNRGNSATVNRMDFWTRMINWTEIKAIMEPVCPEAATRLNTE